MKLHFDEHGIEIPYPRQQLVVTQPLTLGAPPGPSAKPAEQEAAR
jgi:hypothetical protein